MNQWIRVNERLPDRGQKVIYYFKLLGMFIGVYEGDNTFSSRSGVLCDDVTHWMPLPSAPECDK